MILIISTALFMLSATLYGEGNRQRAAEEQAAKDAVANIVKPSPAPAPVPEIPATNPSPAKN
ncbi:MAG: hypothetical protein ACNA7G_00495 [Methylobacter sp.]